MDIRIDNSGDRDFGVIELIDGDHIGTIVTLWIADYGCPVIQIDTPTEKDTHDLIRVFLNDAVMEAARIR